MTTLTGQQIADERLAGWAFLLGGVQTRIATADFATGLALVNAIGAAAVERDRSPYVDLRPTHVDVRLTSPDLGGVSEGDVRLARKITATAAEAGLAPSTATISRLELGLDTPDRATVLPFWAAALALEPAADAGVQNEVRDPAGAFPTVWFQQSGHDEPRQRWHPDVWVDPGQIRPRIKAALAAGGTVISEAEAPAFWVLADPEGNRVCLCTWQDRD